MKKLLQGKFKEIFINNKIELKAIRFPAKHEIDSAELRDPPEWFKTPYAEYEIIDKKSVKNDGSVEIEALYGRFNIRKRTRENYFTITYGCNRYGDEIPFVSIRFKNYYGHSLNLSEIISIFKSRWFRNFEFSPIEFDVEIKMKDIFGDFLRPFTNNSYEISCDINESKNGPILDLRGFALIDKIEKEPI